MWAFQHLGREEPHADQGFKEPRTTLCESWCIPLATRTRMSTLKSCSQEDTVALTKICQEAVAGEGEARGDGSALILP